MKKEVTILTEKYVKKRGGKFYCTVHYCVGSVSVTVGEFQTDDEGVAKAKALELIKGLVVSLETEDA